MNWPTGKYNILYLDPPWSYRTWTAKGGHKSASAHYNTMTTEEIMALAPMVQSIMAEDCAVFMWATYPNLLDAIRVLGAWGAEGKKENWMRWWWPWPIKSRWGQIKPPLIYKTVAFTWIKTNKIAGNPWMGLGYWTRANAEICLLATRGKIRRAETGKGVPQVILAPRREHSRKPDDARDRIVQLMGDLPRIELFARQRVDGWDAWGDEA